VATRGALTPKLKVWVVLEGRVKFGDGRAQLLERAAGFKFLERHPGRGRTRLTTEGRRFLARYRRFRQGLDNVVASHFSRSFRRR
jgi:molybdenum-dependent DNA-binding transcriptional regulator ModE